MAEKQILSPTKICSIRLSRYHQYSIRRKRQLFLSSLTCYIRCLKNILKKARDTYNNILCKRYQSGVRLDRYSVALVELEMCA